MNRESVKGKTIVVTGGAGFIGSHLVDRLIAQDAKLVIVIDNFFLGKYENIQQAINNGAILYREDIECISSLEYIFEKHSVDIVFNLATKALNYSFVNPHNAFMTNVIGVTNLLELQRKHLFSTLCHFSTSEVYGSAEYEPMDEAHPKNPTTTYAAGKAAADLAVKSYVNMFELDAYIVRPFNNFGPRQNYEGYLAGVIPLTARKICNGEAPEIHGEGTQSRDFIYVHDTIDAVLKLHQVLLPGNCINISTDNCFTIHELINKIVKHYGYSGKIIRKAKREADVQSHNASNRKIKDLIDYQLTPFNTALSITLDFYKKKLGRHIDV